MFIAQVVLTVAAITQTISGSRTRSWTPQLGTVEHPKIPGLSFNVNKADIFKFEDEFFYKALKAGVLEEMPRPGNDPAIWRPLTKGTFHLPKSTVDDLIMSVGEVFKDLQTGKYYRSKCIPLNEQPINDCLDEYNIASEWMTLLKQDIGDVRLGDLAIPGSHDTGTTGINVDSFLVDKSFLFSLGDLVVPDVMVNWSRTQDTNVLEQLETGFRQLDMRVADCESLNDTFRWWHGLTGDIIDEGLQHIAEFSSTHPDEIIIIYFQHFVSPGNLVVPTLPISRGRKTELSEIILSYLSDYLVPYVDISDNPTVNEVLATGGNVIALMQDDAIREMDDLYWPISVLHTAYTAQPNPEDLFNDRTEKLKDYLVNHNDTMTDISAASTPDERTVTSAMLEVYGDLPIIEDILERIAPGLNDTDPNMMSFEGVFLDLLNMARYGINTNGMYIRPEEYYSNGISVHYSGVNDMYRHWLARPGIYKPNIVYVDDSNSISSDIVSTAILANLGEIPKEATISFQGNTRNGFYYWEEFQAIGGDEGLNCPNIEARFIIISDDYDMVEIVSTGYEFVMKEGQFPLDTLLRVDVTSPGSEIWHELFTFHIDTNIQGHLDMYIRGDDLGGGSGFAYVSRRYDHFGETCGTPPDGDYISIVFW